MIASHRTGWARALARRAGLIATAALLAASSVASAQQANQQLITTNFKDADITQIAEAVSAATRKNFIVDPRVRAQVTMISATPMSPDAFYQAFLSMLEVHGFIAVPQGDIIKIVPDATARQRPSNDLGATVSPTSDEIVTQVIAVKNVNAAQLVPILRPLVPQYGHLVAYPPSNILIISDRAANVNRILRIVRRVDQESDADVEIIPLQNASAAEIVRVINTLHAGPQAPEGGGATPVKVVADERSNSVLVSGDPSQRLRIKTLIAHLDTPLQAGGNTRVRYLQFADAEKLAAKLKEQITGVAQAAAGQPGGQQGATPAAQIERNTTIWADEDTNALVITADPKVMKSLEAIIDQLDIRRLQVLVEAVIVDVALNKAAELGVNWAVFEENANGETRIPAGAFLGQVGGVSLIDLARGVDNPAQAPAGLASGTTIGIGRITSDGVNFAAMLRALRSDDSSNIIATPSTLTLDNQEAEIKIAREVPFLTGQFTSTGAGDGAVNPFQTIQREEVGTILKLTPQISENNVMLKIELESSDVVPANAGPQGAVDLTTNKRTISTNVLIEDGGILVIGGLISDGFNRQESRVPFLGRIPVVGNLFRIRSSNANRQNLMVFIRPKIIRDGYQAGIVTNEKYRYIRDEQRKVRPRGELIPLLPGTKQPELPEPPPLPPEPPPESRKGAHPADEAQDEKDEEESPAPATPGPAEPQEGSPEAPDSR